MIRVRPTTLTCLAILGAFAWGSMLAGQARASTTLTGDGSTLVAPLVAEWAVAFQAFNNDVTINYIDDGSQAGISDITSRSVDFGASDAPLNAQQLSTCHGCFQIPWALTAIGIGYHINGIRSNLYLNGSVLAQIFLGQITRWNDRRVKALNPRAHLPNLAITPIYAGASGSTYAFTRYLSKVSSTWSTTVGSGLTVSFPVGVSAKSSTAAAGLLHSTNGSIAYIAASYLIANRLPAAAIENSAGRFLYPNLSEIEAAGRTVKSVSSTSALEITDPPRSATDAYPISTYTYVIVPANAPQKQVLANWIGYVLGPGDQFGPQLDFARLPANVQRAANAIYTDFTNSTG